jgi:site-specific recombinase XerD
MATINFFLRPANKKGEHPIVLIYQDKGEKFKHYTQMRVLKTHWNETNQRVKQNCTGFSEINGILDEQVNILKAIERESLFNKRRYSLEVIRKKFLLSIGKVSQESEFFNAYNKFIEQSRTTKSENTIRAYCTTKRWLARFNSEKAVPVSFENIDQNFYEAFLSYLLNEGKLLNNSVGKHIKVLKTFLNYSKDHGITNCNYNLKKFKVFNEDADIIYLTEQELMKIYNLKDLCIRLENVRDVFCFGCLTGLRFSDIDKLRKFHIKGDFLEVKTEKTKDSLRVPLNSFAKAILKKYEIRKDERPLPTGITNQKTNDYLKEIGEIAELNEEIVMEKFSGAKKIVLKKLKWQILTTHTARRTFVTLALEKGIRAEVVMAMTGHKSYKVFKRYIKITDNVMHLEMNRVWNNISQLRVV